MTHLRRARAILRALCLVGAAGVAGVLHYGPIEGTRRLVGALRGRPLWRY